MLNTNKFIFGILTILLAVSFASALQVSQNPLIINVTSGMSNSTTFILTNDEAVNWTDVSLTSSLGAVTLTPSLFNLSNGSSQSITVSANGYTSNQTGNINISYNNGSVQSFLLPIQIKIIQTSIPTSTFNFCGTKALGTNLSISDFSIDNNGEGEDDNWYYLDDVEVSVDVDNNGNKKVSNVEVQIGVYKDGKDVTDDFEFEDNKISLGSISDDDTETAVFKITKMPIDVSEGSYTLYVKAYTTSECDSDYSEIQVTNPFGSGVIVANGIIDTVVEVSAGSTLENVDMDVVNLGDNKEDEVLVNIYNKDLGINQNYHLSDLRSGDSELIYFTALDIPATAVSKTYNIQVTTYYDYDDGDTGEQSSYDSNSYDDLEDDYNTFSFSIKVINGQTAVDPTRPTITAKLDTDATVGKVMNVSISIKNNGASTMATLLSYQDYDSWAKLSSVNPSTLSIAKGETKTVVLTFVPTKEGQQTFKINVLYDGKTISQDVAVNVAKKTGFFSSIFSQANATTYLIAGIILLVVLIVIVLVVKLILSRRA